jgi:hypothetical protein
MQTCSSAIEEGPGAQKRSRAALDTFFRSLFINNKSSYYCIYTGEEKGKKKKKSREIYFSKTPSVILSNPLEDILRRTVSSKVTRALLRK